MSRKKTRRALILQILDDLPWVLREQVKEKATKALRERSSLDQAEVERLYYQAIGLPEAEIQRRMGMETMEIRKPKVHKVKCWKEFFAQLGKKKVEIRKNDRDYQAGDEFINCEWDPTLKEYTGRESRALITNVVPLEKVPGLSEATKYPGLGKTECSVEGFVALSLEFLDTAGGPGYPPIVESMARLMTARLLKNQHRAPMEDPGLPFDHLVACLRRNTHDLEQAFGDHNLGKAELDKVLNQAADVAVYSTFIADLAFRTASGREPAKTTTVNKNYAVAEHLLETNLYDQAVYALNLVSGEVNPEAFIPGTTVKFQEMKEGVRTARTALRKVLSVEAYPTDGPEAGSKGKVVFFDPVEE